MKNEKCILAVNAGSSSLKFRLYHMPSEQLICSGMADRIGQKMGTFSLTFKGEKFMVDVPIKNHQFGAELILKYLIDQQVVASFDEIHGVGHRIVQGGKYFQKSTIISDEVVERVKSLIPLAPLHNKPNLDGYFAFKAVLPNVHHVAVFDTAYHQTMAEEDFVYPIPYELYETHDLRRYGFHGTSHNYLQSELTKVSQTSPKKVITLHLGSGASIAAILDGKVVATSMGLTPLGGIMMGTRTGDVDPSLLHFAALKLNTTHEAIYELFNRQGGLLGVSGLTSDARDLEAAAQQGHARAMLANKIFVRRIADFIGQYFIRLQGIDALIFSAGVGENSSYYRHQIINQIKDALHIEIDQNLNETTRGKTTLLSTPSSQVEVWVIPTNEELMIARDTFHLQ